MNQVNKLMRHTWPGVFILALLLLLQACSQLQGPVSEDVPLAGQARALLIEANKMVEDVTRTAVELKQAGVIERGSQLDLEIGKLIGEANEKLDQASAALQLDQFDLVISNSKAAKQLYFSIRAKLPGVEL